MVGSRLKVSRVIIHISERDTKTDLVASVNSPGKKVLCLVN